MIQCSKDADCPAPYCKGVAAVCSSNSCSYSGRCITQPAAPASFWDKLAALWNQFLTWLNNIFSGGTTPPPATLINFCYQESANVATACGGLATGTYSCVGDFSTTHPCSMFSDGNWNTYMMPASSKLVEINIDYTVPVGASSASLWQIRNYPEEAKNVSIPASCWNSNVLKFRFQGDDLVSPYNGKWSCYTGTAWVDVYSKQGNPIAYEEAMIWNT
jgi:hypothetical protein